MRVGFDRRGLSMFVVLAACGAFAGLLAFSGASASAVGVHVFSASFGGRGSGDGQLIEPAGVAVSEVGGASGDVYVVDRGNNRVEVFDSSGAYLSQFDGSASPTGVFSSPDTIAVDNSSSLLDESAGDVYVADAGHRVVDKFSATGEYLGQITTGSEGQPFKEELSGVAVDANGTVWVYQETNGAELDSYSGAMTNEFLSSSPASTGGRAESGLAIDGEGDLYVVDQFIRRVSKVNGAGEVLGGAAGHEVGGVSQVTGVAAERPSNIVYIDVNNGEAVEAFSADGSRVEAFGSEQLRAGSGLGVNSSTGVVYVADSKANVVDVFPPFHGAVIGKESADNVLVSTAALHARINPNASETTYHFEYDTSPYGTSASHGLSIPVPDGDIGSGTVNVSVTAQLKDLLPGSTYHYRVVAVSEFAPGERQAFDGPDETFTTFASTGSVGAGGCPNEQARAGQPYGLQLPDCRAYEMVSPLDKAGSDIIPNNTRVAVSGEAVEYTSKGSFANPVGARLLSTYISRRGPAGWATQNITPIEHPYDGGALLGAFGELFFTPDLSKGIVLAENTPLMAGERTGYVNLYVADTGSGTYTTVTNVHSSEERPYAGSRYFIVAGASTDLSHVVFNDPQSLTPEASVGHLHVYEWADGKVSLIDVAPEGTTFEGEDEVGAPNGSLQAMSGDKWHAVSNDGLRVFFTAGDPAVSKNNYAQLGQVYVREVNEARTIEVSASHKTNGSGPGGADPLGARAARYWAASADGSRVFFTSRSELTDDANTGPADNASNLYEYNVDTGVLKDLTVDTNAGDPNGAEMMGVVTASEDGSYMYFVAKGRLAEGATSGEPNLYLYHAGKTRFVATLDAGDVKDWYGEEDQEGEAEFENGPGAHTVRVTPDGTRLAFESVRRLTSYDNEPVEPGACEKNKCKEVYLYNATSDSLACASCDPSGASPVGPAKLGGRDVLGGNFGTVLSPFYTQRNLSENGRRLFFTSPDALVPHDSNGRQDVYEYEEGHVSPISNVAGNYDSYFMDASPNGEDVFIDTADQLLLSDEDFRLDVYDVKVGGGFPTAAAPPDCNNGDSCKAPVSPQPGVFGPPASATFTGAGNAKTVAGISKPQGRSTRPVKCRKGFARRHGRCVRKTAKKSRDHSKKGRK